MKKSVLAVAIAAAAFAASAASAAQVYDKDGTTLAVGGQIEFMAGSAGNGYFSNSGTDSTTRDRARLTMAGRTQLSNSIAAYAYNEWQIDHKGNSEENQDVAARQQYLGVDFGKFGKVQVGRYTDPFEYASNLVDVLDEVGVFGGNDERNSGHVSYMWSGFGFDAGISYQFAVDNYRNDVIDNDYLDVDSGFSIYAGYTSPAVLFGPISVRAGYLYLNGQDKDDGASATTKVNKLESVNAPVDDFKSIDGALAWGTNGKGFYVATNYNYTKVTFLDNDTEIKDKAWESVATYGFANGIRLGASYHYVKFEKTAPAADNVEGDMKFVQLIADYNVTPNFKVWAEGLIDAGSDDNYGRLLTSNNKDGHNSVMFGARYVF